MDKGITNKIKYSDQFDGSRGLLMFSIFILHLHFTYIKAPTIIANFTLHCFFLASGYLITSILLKAKEKVKSFKQFFWLYYIKRILRIFPVYFAYIFCLLAISSFVKITLHHDFFDVIKELKQYGIYLISFTYNFKDLLIIYFNNGILSSSSLFGHLWSISMEEQFYILIPFLVYFISPKNLKRLSMCMIVLFPIIRIVGYYILKSKTDNTLLIGFTMIRCSIFQFDTFFYGILAALITNKNIKLLRKIFYLSAVLLFLTDAINLYRVQQLHGIPFYEMISRYDFYAISGAATYMDILLNICCFSFLILIFESPREFPLLLNKRLVEYGKFSYGAYVYQYLFILITYYFIFESLKNRMPLLAVEIICTVFCMTGIITFSKLSYYKYELYFINLKDKFISKLKK